jgi:hypothetical protein
VFCAVELSLSAAFAGLHPSASKKAGNVTQPMTVQMQPLNENGSLARASSEEPFASLNPLSQRGKAGGGAAAAGTRSRAPARGGRESPDAVEMHLTGGSHAEGVAADARLADDEFSDFVGAEDASGATQRSALRHVAFAF